MQRVKVGDLVKVANDDTDLFGHGVVLEVLPDNKHAIIRWFDDWQDSDPLDVDEMTSLVVISES